MLGPKNVWSKKKSKSNKFLYKKNLEPKEFWARKNVAQKIQVKKFDPKKFWYKKYFGQKEF